MARQDISTPGAGLGRDSGVGRRYTPRWGAKRTDGLHRQGLLVAVSLIAAIALISAGAPTLAATPPKAEVRGVSDKALRTEIQQVIGQAPPPTSRLEARRRAGDAADQITAVLRSEGYYDAEVDPDIGDGDSPQPFVTVTLGPRALVADPKIAWLDTPPDVLSAKAAMEAMALKPGSPGRAADVIAAETRIIAALQQRGYADVAAEPRNVVVDHTDYTMKPEFRIRAGPLVRLGGIEIQGKSRARSAWVTRLAPWRRGDVYKPQSIAGLEKLLVDTGAFDQVSVVLAPASELDHGVRPVVVTLTPRPKGTVELGASYSTTEGAGIDSRWLVYNRLGLGDTVTTLAQLAQIDSRLQTELSLPDWRKLNETLKLTAALYRDNTPAYDLKGGGLAADLTHKFGQISFITYGVSLDETNTMQNESADFIRGARDRHLTTVGTLFAFTADNSNDPLDPTKGFRFGARLEPTLSVGDGSITYLKGSAQASLYYPLRKDAGTVLAVRLKMGVIAGGAIPGVPPQDRFYSGGGGSVRGYGYQEVGPRYPDNTPEGGLSVVESSVEVRQRINNSWGLAAFVDTGYVGSQTSPDFTHPEVGAGVGVRYNLGFGPIRFDIATPLVRRDGDAAVQVYLSIGQSF
jgi:translocation and assembly module TamA